VGQGGEHTGLEAIASFVVLQASASRDRDVLTVRSEHAVTFVIRDYDAGEGDHDDDTSCRCSTHLQVNAWPDLFGAGGPIVLKIPGWGDVRTGDAGKCSLSCNTKHARSSGRDIAA
jgi:hypothetical protein